MKTRKIFPYLMVLPMVLFTTIFVIYPSFANIYNGFFRWDGFGEKIFIGLQNFFELSSDDLFFQGLKNTFIYAAIVVGGTTIIGFILALFIDKKIKGWQFFRFIYFLPVIMAMVVAALLWIKFYDPAHGLFNNLLDLLHLSFLKQNWLGDPNLALVSISFVTFWQFAGYTMIFFLAGLKTISFDIYDAAKIDGASYPKTVFYIIIPLMKKIILIVSLLMVIFAFKVFDTMWVMTRGGPMNSSQVLASLVYVNAFKYYRVGYASAIANIAILISLVFSGIYLYFSFYREKE